MSVHPRFFCETKLVPLLDEMFMEVAEQWDALLEFPVESSEGTNDFHWWDCRV